MTQARKEQLAQLQVREAQHNKMVEVEHMKKLNKIKKEIFDENRKKLEKQHRKQLNQLKKKHILEDKSYKNYLQLKYELLSKKSLLKKESSKNMK